MACGGKCESRPKYTETLTVRKPGTTADLAGHVNLKDAANRVFVRTILGRFLTQGGREWFVFKQTMAETTHVIEARWTPDVNKIIPKWWFEMDGRTFEIVKAYDVDEAHRVMRFEAVEQK